ncbi:MAG: hypothetical protein ACQGTM_05805 [bacterium]
MEIKVDANRVMREWPHVEKYHNTTLRYTPDKRFPEAMEAYIGRPEMIRLFITLDEVWDYRDNTYHWNYLIGENRYQDDPNHYHYDWPLTVPSPLGVHVEEYLTSHAACADTVLLNIRRYEREVTDGLVSFDQYEEVFKKVVEHYKALCPNIVYIECCNEVEIPNFGELTMPEFYNLYKRAYRAIDQLNAEHSYETPLLVGGFGMSAGMTNWKYWDEFLEILAKDKDRKIDFYSMHEYHTNPGRILQFYVRHEAKIKELNLPDLPLLMTEYGLRTGVGDAGRPNNLQNASGEIAGMILGSYCKNLKMFPWCSFHNPNQQLGRTMFVLNDQNQYVPTPSGHVMKMLHMLGDRELLIEGYVNDNCVATMDRQGAIQILAANPGAQINDYDLEIFGLKEGTYLLTEYYVDGQHNNWISDHSLTGLSVTGSKSVAVKDRLKESIRMMNDSFCLFTIEKQP